MTLEFGQDNSLPYDLDYKKLPCRRCTECADREHHWMDNVDFGNEDEPDADPQATHVCKHCPALGKECVGCFGDGCDDCNGEGVLLLSRGTEKESP